MKKFLIITVVTLVAVATVFSFIPEKQLKYTTKELAKEADINPKLANFILHTKLGRKIAYIAVKKKLRKKLKEEQRKENN